MNEEEKFDELLSSGLSERDFPFDELNWDEAERLIIQQENRRKISRFAIIFSAGLLAGALIMLPFIISTHNALPNTLAIKSTSTNQTTVTQNNIPASVTSANQSGANTDNTIGNKEKAPLPVHSAFVKKNTRTGIRSNSSSNLSAIAQVHKEHTSPLVASVNRSHRHSKLSAKSNLLASVEESNKKPQPTEVENREVKNTSPSQPTNNAVAKNGLPLNASEKTEKNNSPNTAITNTDNSGKPIASNSSKPGKNISPNTAASKNSTASATTSNKPAIKKDSNSANAPPLLRDAEPESDHNDYPPNILSVYAGGNYSFGWNDNGDKEADGITPYGGFTYTHYFGKRISASIGVGYLELNNLNRTYTTSTTQYDFGANATITTITPQTIYYAVFPLKLQYKPDRKDIFGIGLDYLLMMTTSGMLTTYKQTYFLETAGTSKKEYGYSQGFSNSDMQFTFIYTRMLLHRLGISAEGYLGFNSIENSSFPGSSEITVEREPIYTKNTGFRLTLSYQLTK